MFCTACGTRLADGSAFCAHCGKPTASAPPAGVVLDKSPAAVPTHLADEVPEGVKGWSWGAFLLTWIWAIGNRTWIGLLALVPYVGFGVAIWLGIKGREMAWKNGRWDSVEHFKRVQRKWSCWGVGIVVGAFVLGIVAAIAIPAYDSYVKRARQAHEKAVIEPGDAADSTAETAPGPASAPAEISDSGIIDTNADSLPTALITSAGMLKRSTDEDKPRAVTLNGKALFSGDNAPWQFPVRSFTLSGDREAILMATSGGRGNSCETMFFFLVIDKKDVQSTPEFGTCAPQGKFTQHGDIVALALPKMGGVSTFELRKGAVFEDGRALTLDDSNDPAL